MRQAAVLTVCVVGVTAMTFAQATPPPQPTFRTGVDLVQVDVSVLDKDRHPVPGLAAADFTVREDGKVRPVVAFSAVTLPARPPDPPAPWMRDVPSDIVTNLTTREGRLVVILFDYSILPEDMPGARRTAEAAVDQLGPGDLAAVIYTTDGVPQNFTADRSLLRAAIRQPFLGIGAAPDDPIGAQRGECSCGVCSLEAMTHVADAVREVPHRRKMLLFIGTSIAVTTTDIRCSAEVKSARTNLLRAAGAANLSIHAFDSTLLQSLGGGASYSYAPPGDHTSHLVRQNDLGFYPGETGGRIIKNTNAPWAPMPAMFAESASYYVLAFAPAVPKSDGLYHDISVEVNRRDVEVHPRKGYYAPSPAVRSKVASSGPPTSLTAALANLWPDTGMPLSVSAAAFATPGKPGAAVAIVLRAREPVAVEGPAGRAGRTTQELRVQVLAGAYGREGQPLDSQVQTLAVNTPPGAQQVFEYEVISRLRLEPGRHEVRVAAEDVSRHLTGSVYTYVDVPNFLKAPLSLSGVVISTSASTSGGDLHDLLPLTPTARRQFAPSDHVSAFLRVYQQERGTPLPVTMTARIIDASNHTALEQHTPLFHAGEAPARSASYRLDIPLTSLGAGQYVLTIEAARGVKETARRDVIFAIR